MVLPIIEIISILGILTITIFYLQPRLQKRSSQPPLYITSGRILSVSLSSNHVFSKPQVNSIILLKGLGVEGDCHCGATVQHLSRMKVKPSPPNLRQVHLIHSELFQEFKTPDADGKKYIVCPGDLGENIATEGLDLLALGVGTKLHFINPGEEEDEKGNNHAVVIVTGLRNPCPQISNFQKGLQERCLVRGVGREVVERKAGIMSVVDVGGVVMRGARICVEMPGIWEALDCV